MQMYPISVTSKAWRLGHTLSTEIVKKMGQCVEVELENGYAYLFVQEYNIYLMTNLGGTKVG
jgi:hypothetical protein